MLRPRCQTRPAPGCNAPDLIVEILRGCRPTSWSARRLGVGRLVGADGRGETRPACDGARLARGVTPGRLRSLCVPFSLDARPKSVQLQDLVRHRRRKCPSRPFRRNLRSQVPLNRGVGSFGVRKGGSGAGTAGRAVRKPCRSSSRRCHLSLPASTWHRSASADWQPSPSLERDDVPSSICESTDCSRDRVAG